jgi:hypothetical protein
VIPRDLAAYVQRRRPPEDVYTAAADAVEALAKGLRESSDSSPALQQLLDEVTRERGAEFLSAQDEQLFEYMSRSGLAQHLVASSASTGGDTLSRVLFYLEYGRHLGDVPLLGPGKARWLKVIGQRMQSSLHEVIAKRFEDTTLATITARLSDAFAPSQISPPPVAELVLRRPLQKD